MSTSEENVPSKWAKELHEDKEIIHGGHIILKDYQCGKTFEKHLNNHASVQF